MNNLKPIDLRIGNWAESTRGQFQVSIENISDFENGHIKLEPIPLTEDWLVKFGFKDEGHGYQKKIEDSVGIFISRHIPIHLSRIKDKEGYFIETYYSFIEVKYVNQLQNIWFSLQNKELEIK